MLPKTERLELRLSNDFIEKIDTWRSNRIDVPSRSEAIRRLVEEGLKMESQLNLQPTNPEKLILWMLTQIRRDQINERVDQKNNIYDMKDIELIEKAIYGGHFWALDWELNGILHHHIDDPEKVSFVVNVLDMWSFIERACKDFGEVEQQRLISEVGSWAKEPKFIGFDGNNEGEYRRIAQFLVEEMHRFTEFKGHNMNSHTRTVDRYRKMLMLFENIRPNLVGRELDIDEIIELFKREIA